MKYNKKASILLWAIMLSLIISISFITISVQINKNIKLSWNISKFLGEQNELNLRISEKKSDSFWDNNILVFQDNKKIDFWLKKNEEKDFSFSGSNDFSINIIKINWADIFFSYYKNNSLTDSWIIDSSETFSWKLDSTNTTWILKIKNLWWYSRVFLETEIPFDINYWKYKIITKIWNNYFNKIKK